MFEDMTIIRTILPLFGQIITKIEDHYPAIQSDECNLFYEYNWIQYFVLTIMLRHLRRINLLTNRIKDVTIS